MANFTEIQGGAAVHSTRVDSLSRWVRFQLSRGSSHTSSHHLQLVLARWSPPFPLQQQEIYHLLRVVTAPRRITHARVRIASKLLERIVRYVCTIEEVCFCFSKKKKERKKKTLELPKWSKLLICNFYGLNIILKFKYYIKYYIKI